MVPLTILSAIGMVALVVGSVVLAQKGHELYQQIQYDHYRVEELRKAVDKLRSTSISMRNR